MKNQTINDCFVGKQSPFWTPEYLVPSAWIEHVPFAFWLVETLKPKCIVELGVHNGVSYFSFCQAVKALNLNAACYGIDTWQGDVHAGYYDETIYTSVGGHNSTHYSLFSTLVRSTFDEARNYFINQSIDLLHIDGLHTYDAVKHDFEMWLPKLTPNAVVAFHDINVREREFGVFKFWEELKTKYEYFQFDFGHGLGIISMGEIHSDCLKKIFSREKEDNSYLFIRNLFFERGYFFKSKFYASLAAEAEYNNKLQLVQQENKLLREQCLLLNSKLEENDKAIQSIKNENIEVKEKFETDILGISNKLNVSNSIIDQQTNDLSYYKKNNDILVNHISWYRATFEQRSFIGVIKEKLKQTFNKRRGVPPGYVSSDKTEAPLLQSIIKPNGLRNYRLVLINKDAILENNRYSFTDPDPSFYIDLENKKLHKGWYFFSIVIKAHTGSIILPKIYYDCGNGFSEEYAWDLPEPKQGKIECFLNFPSTVSTLRFDPSSTVCTLEINSFHLKWLSKLRAIKTAMSEYKKAHAQNSSYFTVFIDFLLIFFKKGKVGLREKVWNTIVYNRTKHEDAYDKWCTLFDTITAEQLNTIEALSDELAYKPLLSVIMPVYNAPPIFLKKAIESVRNQAYKNWELCIADDKSTNSEIEKVLSFYMKIDSRIKIVFRETNGHISHASNSALDLAIGEYIVLLDQDDEILPHALYLVAKAINENNELGIIYSDEDKIDEKGQRFDPYFKTDWNKDLFYGQNMINHLGVYKHSLIKKIGGFRPGFEGSQDYDLALRCIEHLREDQIYHIPHILYHWRAVKGSTAVTVTNKSYAVEAGIKALNEHFKRTNKKGIAEKNINNSYRVRWPLPEVPPLVSIIIPTKDKVDILKTCVQSIFKKTNYSNFEILIIDNNSQEIITQSYLKSLSKENNRVKVFNYVEAFNFSAISNFGVAQANGDIILLLNNDTEVLNEGWMSEVVSQCVREEIGVVGVKLYYPNGQIQHAGVFLSNGHPGIHIYLKKDKNDDGYVNKLNLVQNYSAVTAACFAVRKEIFKKVGGLNENDLKVAYNDVDFCLKVKAAGYKNLWTPFAQLVHYESLSRGDDLNEANLPRFKQEHSYMLRTWAEAINNDPFFNPNLDVNTHTTRYAHPPKKLYEWQEKEEK